MDNTESRKRPASEMSDKDENSNKRPHIPERRETTIFGIKPVDDIVQYVADFIATHCDQENVEIEGKLGLLIDKQTRRRINMNAVTETVIGAGLEGRVRFESNMPLAQHKHFNEMLNALVTKSNARGYRGERIHYKHTYETDRFYHPNNNARTKWRVTTNQQTGQLVENGIIEKIRVADLNIHAPTQPLDYRISINLEIPRPKPTGNPVFERNKDRVSYKHGGIHFDLTQVKGAADKDPDVRHELELEIMDPAQLARERSKMARGEPSHYLDTIESFVNNIRILSRKALKIPHNT
ncbi:hypothetical protein O0I10_002857 [Lichtheimia ornata]|uniref:mRNA-capping enzyme subunit beta n=1 Tax=Lichtheimia ornata TaxID=688661 RepID=A0AAD7V9S5_9FUNG|nr:uncharacterized protein O0I10_002857 [Lichtheimia ornata]KAJ8661589.1 hypothetical protein O0I10_002857 [Lichtheimia ornata]